jgi:molecular chaperone GrpE
MSHKEKKEECKCEEVIKKLQDEKTLLENEKKIVEIDLKETQDKYIRTLAEMDNLRKRMQKEKQESISYAVESTISEFLSLIDNFENALNFAKESSDEVRNWSFGFQMILSQMKDAVHNHGIIAYHSLGCKYDPNLHEAMEIVETNEKEDGTIVEEYAKGYKSSDRVIRPAKVKVTKKIIETVEQLPTSDDETTKNIENNEDVSSCD